MRTTRQCYEPNWVSSKLKPQSKSFLRARAVASTAALVFSLSCSRGGSASSLFEAPSEFASSVEDFYSKAKLDDAYNAELAKHSGSNLESLIGKIPDKLKFGGDVLGGLSAKADLVVKSGNFAAFQKKHKDLKSMLSSYGASLSSLKARDVDTGIKLVHDFARAPKDKNAIKQVLGKYSEVDTAKAIAAMVILDSLNNRYGGNKTALNLGEAENQGLSLDEAPYSGAIEAGFNAAEAWSPSKTLDGIGNAATGIGAGHLAWKQGDACGNQGTAIKDQADKQAEWYRCLNVAPTDADGNKIECTEKINGKSAPGGRLKGRSDTHCGTLGFRWTCDATLLQPEWELTKEPDFKKGQVSDGACTQTEAKKP